MAARFYDYLLLGNSAAAIAAVESIRAIDADASVCMVSPEAVPAYGRPLISYLLEGKTTLERMSLRPASFYGDNRVDTVFGQGGEAVALNPETHTVTLSSGDVISYGKVLVATGSIPFVPPIKGLMSRSNVSTFLSLEQAQTCAEAVGAATAAAHACGRESRVVVVGGGLIGLKAAEALLPYVDHVVVLEMAPRILPAVLDDAGAALLASALEERGIVCMPGITASEFTGEGDSITAALLTDGSTFECDYVVAAVGVRPNAALLEEAGAEMGRGVVVDETLRTSLPDVYAAGDVTQTTDLLDGSEKCLALWPNAVRQGRLAGAHMAGDATAEMFEGNFAVNAVDFFDLSLLTSGIINPDPEAGYTETVTVEGDTYTKFVTKDDRLFGYILLNRPENAGIYTALISRRVPLSSLSGDILTTTPRNLDFDEKIRWFRLHMGYPVGLDRNGWKERA